MKAKIIDIQELPTGEGILTIEDNTILHPFQVPKSYMDFNPVVGGYYTAEYGVEGFSLN